MPPRRANPPLTTQQLHVIIMLLVGIRPRIYDKRRFKTITQKARLYTKSNGWFIALQLSHVSVLRAWQIPYPRLDDRSIAESIHGLNRHGERMTFNINLWRATYNKIALLGAVEKAHTHSMRDFGKPVLTEEEVAKIRSKTRALSEKATAYMNFNGVTLPPAAWVYSATDERTWMSSPKFAYQHLVY